MGIVWYLDVGAPTGADGAPTPSSWAGEGPDDVVRPGIRRSQAAEPYDLKPARRCGELGLTPPEAVTRTAALATTAATRRPDIRDVIARWLLGSAQVQPHNRW